MGLFCDHDWEPRSGMDTGSVCAKCTALSDKEVDVLRSSGLNNGQLRSGATPSSSTADDAPGELAAMVRLNMNI